MNSAPLGEERDVLTASDYRLPRPVPRGAALEPGGAGYEEARKVYDAMIDRKPRLIVKCTDVGDVMAAVRMAKTNALRFPSVAAGTTRPVWASAMTA